MTEKCIIIGSGPAGLTAAIYAARAGLEPLVFEGMAPGGQLMGTTEVENFPGFRDGITGPELMTNMREQAKKFGAKTVFQVVDSVDFSDVANLKVFSGSESFVGQSVIVATGASAMWLDLKKGEERFQSRGYSACATCDGAFYKNKVVGVVGGGDTALEEAEFLTRFASKVYVMHRRDKFRASLPLQERVEKNSKIEVLWNTVVVDLCGESLLESVDLMNTVSSEVSSLELSGLFVAVGHKPNTGFLGDSLELDDRGFLRVLDSTKTKVSSVFVAGDVADPRYQQAVTAASSGCMAAMDCEAYLAAI